MDKDIKSNCHLVVRYSDPVINYNCIDTIEEHKSILKKNKSVVFGKMGKTLGDKNIQRLLEQIEASIDTYVYLVKRRETREYLTYRCKLEIISKTPIKKFIHPKYYSELRGFKLWFLFSDIEEAKRDILLNLKTISSMLPVINSLVGSMASLFLVKE